MRQVYFVTGIGTNVGKTIVSAILAEALGADYWKPVQAGFPRDGEWVREHTSDAVHCIHNETYLLNFPASPHLSAKQEQIEINIERIYRETPINDRNLIIEGAGGLMVPLNSEQFVVDLIAKLQCKVILVSRNYLGSINHSLLTAAACRNNNVPVAGWIFVDQFMDYEQQIVEWSGYPHIFSVPFTDQLDKAFITKQADQIKENLARILC